MNLNLTYRVLISWTLLAFTLSHVGRQTERGRSKPHIISILIDDLGYDGTGITDRDKRKFSSHITRLAQEAHWHCSPSRRSFLTGRLPIHHGESLSDDLGDDIDLRMKWISQKMKQAGYITHMYGKAHTGFASMRHLPINNGFDHWLGSLDTGGSYQGPLHSPRWFNGMPLYIDNNDLRRRIAAVIASIDSKKSLIKPNIACDEMYTDPFAVKVFSSLQFQSSIVHQDRIQPQQLNSPAAQNICAYHNCTFANLNEKIKFGQATVSKSILRKKKCPYLNNTALSLAKCATGQQRAMLRYSPVQTPAKCCAICAELNCAGFEWRSDAKNLKIPVYVGIEDPAGSCVIYMNTCISTKPGRYGPQGSNFSVSGTVHQEDTNKGMPNKRKGRINKTIGEAACINAYSTDLYGALAVFAVSNHSSKDIPLYMHLCFQAVHHNTEWMPPRHVPGYKSREDNRMFQQDILLRRVDYWIGRLIIQLKTSGLYNSTLIVVLSDNGAKEGQGTNYPLRGAKHTNWEGGLRTLSFVSGGFVPKLFRGTTSALRVHIADWYATFATIAGVSPKDDPPIPPLPISLENAGRNIYGNLSFPPVDGKNIWPFLIQGKKSRLDAAHQHLVLTREVILSGRYKLIVGQPNFHRFPFNGWLPRNQSKDPVLPNTLECTSAALLPSEKFMAHPHGAFPCLFDLKKDPSERTNIANLFPERVKMMWDRLKRSFASHRDCSGSLYKNTGFSIPGPIQDAQWKQVFVCEIHSHNCIEIGRHAQDVLTPRQARRQQLFPRSSGCSPPKLLGECNPECARRHWYEVSGRPEGPVCGVCNT